MFMDILWKFSYFIMKLYTVCTHSNRLLTHLPHDLALWLTFSGSKKCLKQLVYSPKDVRAIEVWLKILIHRSRAASMFMLTTCQTLRQNDSGASCKNLILEPSEISNWPMQTQVLLERLGSYRSLDTVEAYYLGEAKMWTE